MADVYWGVPMWGWVIIVLLGWIHYTLVQLSRQLHSHYLLIMKRLGADVDP